MKGYLEAIKLNLENRTLTKKFLAGRVTDDELLDIALKIRAKSPTPSPKAGRLLIDFTARDNPNVRFSRYAD